MYELSLRKPDGRELTLYSRKPNTGVSAAPSPFSEPLTGKPHMRWHPLRNEWVTYAAYRQDRTFLPTPEYNPFAVTVSSDNFTELPRGDWDIAVFDNRFPALDLNASEAPALPVASRSATAKFEDVVLRKQQRDPQTALP